MLERQFFLYLLQEETILKGLRGALVLRTEEVDFMFAHGAFDELVPSPSC